MSFGNGLNARHAHNLEGTVHVIIGSTAHGGATTHVVDPSPEIGIVRNVQAIHKAMAGVAITQVLHERSDGLVEHDRVREACIVLVVGGHDEGHPQGGPSSNVGA